MGKKNSEDFSTSVILAYEEVINWRKNIFILPNGHAGTAFVEETARLFHSYASRSPLEQIALKCIAIMTHLILQKPFLKSKTKDHIHHLSRRMELWKDGNITELLCEARLLQQRYQTSCLTSNRIDDIPRRFTTLMQNGKLSNAIRLISEKTKGGILPLNQEVLNLLSQKHPPSEPLDPDAVINTPTVTINPILFAGLNGDEIRKSAIATRGGAGPSGGMLINGDTCVLDIVTPQIHSVKLCLL